MNPKLTVVTGMPRSGTSLMMRVFHESGIQVLADEPGSFELKATNLLADGDTSWMESIPSGCVIKVLFPDVLSLPPTFDYLFIWMMRNPREQAKSQRKLAGWPRKDLGPRTSLIKKINKKIKSDRLLPPGERIIVQFKDLVSRPQWTCARISLILGIPIKSDCIVRRDPKWSKLPQGTLEVRDAP